MWGGGTAWDRTQGHRRQRYHELLKDSQWGTGPHRILSEGLAPSGCWIPTGKQDVALLENLSSHWETAGMMNL